MSHDQRQSATESFGWRNRAPLIYIWNKAKRMTLPELINYKSKPWMFPIMIKPDNKKHIHNILDHFIKIKKQ